MPIDDITSPLTTGELEISIGYVGTVDEITSESQQTFELPEKTGGGEYGGGGSG